MFYKTLVMLAGILLSTSSYGLTIGTIQILQFNGEDKVLTEGFESREPIIWKSDTGQALLDGIVDGTYDLIFIHEEKVGNSIRNNHELKVSKAIAANAIGMFVPNKMAYTIVNKLNAAVGRDPLPALVSMFTTLDLKIQMNNLGELKKVIGILKEQYNFSEAQICNNNRYGMDAVRLAANNNQATIMGLHPALQQGGFCSSVFTIDSPYFYVPVVAVYRGMDGEALVNHILSNGIQEKIESVRHKNHPNLALWKSGASYRNAVKPLTLTEKM